MAQQVLVEMVDDIDGTTAAQTVPFSLDGISYEIDLSAVNAGALRDELARYVAASRRVGGRKVRLAVGQSSTGSPAGGPADRERSRQIRAWAIDNGYEISERGRIPANVISAHEQAEQDAASAEAAAATPRKRAIKKKVAAAKR